MWPPLAPLRSALFSPPPGAVTAALATARLAAPCSALRRPCAEKGERSGAAAAAHPAPLRLLLASLWQLGALALLQVEGEIERIERDKGSSEDDM